MHVTEITSLVGIQDHPTDTLVADFQKSLQQRDSELETPRAKVSTPNKEGSNTIVY